MQVWDNLREDVKQRIEKYSNRAIQMATTNSINLQKLSPKKRTALSCIAAGINETTIDANLKKNWFNWIYYMMKFITDSQVDQMAKAMQGTIQDYMMTYFEKDFVNSMPEHKKEAAAVLFKRFHKEDAAGLELSEEFDQFIIK